MSAAAMKEKALPSGLTSRGPPGHSLSCNRNQPMRRQLLLLLRSCRQGWLHYVFHNVFTDLEPHIRADLGREAVMEAGPDTSTRNLVGKGRRVGKAVCHAGCGSTRYRYLRNVLGSERRLNDAGYGAAEDAMRARVFRVHR